MNSYIQKAFERFKQFFLAASTVDPPNQKFGYDEYTDVIMVTRPVIYITVKEVLRTHTVSLYMLVKLCISQYTFSITLYTLSIIFQRVILTIISRRFCLYA